MWQPFCMSQPDLQFSGLSVWVRKREFPDATDYWDSNWLVVRIIMQSAQASVATEGAILMTTDFVAFRNQLVAMNEAVAGEAFLSGLEPNIKVTLSADTLGHISGQIEITPDHLTEFHRFEIGMDQTYLPALIASCDAILERFPVVNLPSA